MVRSLLQLRNAESEEEHFLFLAPKVQRYALIAGVIGVHFFDLLQDSGEVVGFRRL